MTGAPRAIVAIGASAGGLDAFQRFFENMPADSGLAFVVLLHLPASSRSMLPDILARWTGMRVVDANDGDPVEPDCVYVPPPHATVALRQDGHFNIRLPAPDQPRHGWAIDGFFDSLAAHCREAAVGIVMSGTGSDGTLGIKAVKEAGGLTLAQGTDHSSPQFEAMPAGAIASGAVDLVATAEAMPAHLLRLLAARAAPLAIESLSAGELERTRLSICAVLRSQLGHDFSGYKERTFMRRVQRRMQVNNIVEITDYVSRLEADPQEVVLLFRELLIRVTSFFRDIETFETLEHLAIPRLFHAKQADSTVRVWVPGCATGEEAYSLAILLREYAETLASAPKVHVFATDIDDRSIATARTGRYPATLLEGVSPERLARFFVRADTGYQVSSEIRELCTFSTHSLVRDPPFSRIDMISCRNLLIYMDSTLQATVIPAFHYSLVPDGILLLGTSETIARHDQLFAPLDQTSRIFIRRNVRTPALRLFPTVGRQERWREPGTDGQSEARMDNLNVADRKPPQASTPGLGGGQAAETEAGIARGTGWSAMLRRTWETLLPQARERDELRRLLQQTQDRLQAVTEDHESALEELRGANEELHAVNEEIQSTNEELETSREELQSVNEELHTSNAQLSEKLEELDRKNSDLRNLFESTDVATVFLDRNMIIRGYTPAVGTIYNLIPSDIGRPLTDIVNRLRYTSLREDVRRVLATLEPLERRVSQEDGQSHYIMRILPYRDSDSGVNGTLVTFLDVTSIVRAERHQSLLLDELNHRVKNMLTVVISLASQTLRRSDTMEAFATAFMGRIEALTASYSLLSQSQWVSVLLRDVLNAEIRPFTTPDRQTFHLDGPDVHLAPQGVLALGMATHELATNAVKYGALSVPQGSVRINWRVEGEGSQAQFVLDWHEAGGPPVAPPPHRGFGIALIERGFAHELSGAATLAFPPDGLHATLRAPAAVALAPQRPATLAPLAAEATA